MLTRGQGKGLALAAVLFGIATTAHAGEARIQYASLGNAARAPIGWVEFCHDRPGDCRGGRSQPRDSVMSQTAWRDLVRVNRWVNDNIKPMTDMEHWGVVEKWSLPTDGYGDCEDYVLLKRKMLIDAGWPREALAVAVVRSPHWHASFAFGDLDAFVAQRPGIEAVFTAADIAGRNRFGVIPAYADQPALAEETVRFRGEAVALVAGSRDAMAGFDASDFPVFWTELPHTLNQIEARREGAPLVHEDRTGNLLIEGAVRRGDPDTALGSSAVTVSGALATSYVEHAYVEPEAGFAFMDGETLVIRACTQSPFMDRDDTAAVLGLAPEKVRIVPTATGGGFFKAHSGVSNNAQPPTASARPDSSALERNALMADTPVSSRLPARRCTA